MISQSSQMTDKKRVIILSTGGTIASTSSNYGLIPTMSAEDIAAYVPDLKELCDLSYKTIFNLDSTNIQPEEWIIISRSIFEALTEFDAVIVLHGTDTMAYTISAVSYMLQNLDKSVIFTGSQYPVNSENSDAPTNIYHAVLAAIQGVKGVYLVFDGRIILGTRAVKVRTVSTNTL